MKEFHKQGATINLSILPLMVAAPAKDYAKKPEGHVHAHWNSSPSKSRPLPESQDRTGNKTRHFKLGIKMIALLYCSRQSSAQKREKPFKPGLTSDLGASPISCGTADSKNVLKPLLKQQLVLTSICWQMVRCAKRKGKLPSQERPSLGLNLRGYDWASSDKQIGQKCNNPEIGHSVACLSYQKK